MKESNSERIIRDNLEMGVFICIEDNYIQEDVKNE